MKRGDLPAASGVHRERQLADTGDSIRVPGEAGLDWQLLRR